MKKFILPIVMAISVFSVKMSAQVGINTALPTTTLDIAAKNATGASTNVDGVLIPRVDRQRAQNMIAIPASTLVYVNSVANGDQTGNALNIDSVGYYYFEGAAWVKLANPNNTPFALGNIYTTSGTLNSNRVVNQSTFPLSFTTNLVNGFSVAGSALSVDGANSRLGIGTAAPSVKLDVEGSQLLNAAVTGSATKNALDINVGQDGFTYGNRTDNFGINMKSSSSIFPGTISRINFGDTSTGTAVGPRYLSFSVGITPNELMYLTDANAGRVGIGSIAPAAKLDIVGTTFGIKNSEGSGSWDNLWFNVTSSIPSINASGAEAGLQFNVGSNSVGTYGDGQTLTTVATMRSNGNMGVGTTTPATKFHVEGAEVRISNAASVWGLDPEGTSPTSQFSIIDRTNSARRLILQENGNAYLGGALGSGGANATISSVGGSVGIGSNAAPTNTLDVNGTTRIRTINIAAGTTVVTPVYTDNNGVVLNAATSTYGGTTSALVNIAAGATGTLITGMVDGALYKAIVIVGDGCSYVTTAEFYVANNSFNSNFSIKGIDGIFSNGSSKAPTFTETNRTTTGVAWSGKPGCADTGNTTSLNYNLVMPSAGTINITNVGNIARSYRIILTRLS